MHSVPRINPLERLILLSADDEGCIPVLQAKTMNGGKGLKVMTLMERLGVLRHEAGNQCYRLTETGRRLRATLRTT